MAQDIFATSPDLDLRKRWALLQLQQASDASPVRHPLQAVARALQGAMGGYLAGQAEQEDRAAGASMFNNLPGLGGGQAQTSPAPVSSSNAPPTNFGNAIASIESGGKYDALGPVTKSGDRAYGKYQIMGANVGPWTKEVLGQEMNPQAFAASPQAQDAVFNAKFGQYAQKYGPEGAARAWFAGEGGMNNLNAKDQLGTTVGQYGQRFAQAAGLPQVASDSPAIPQGAAPTQFQGQQPGQQAQTPARTQLNIPPEVAATIQRLGSDARTRGQAWQLYLQYAKPTEQYVQGVNANGVPYQRNVVTGRIEADPTRDAAINEAEYARSNWQKLGFPDPNSAASADQQFWQSFNAKRLGGPSTNVTVDQRGENEFSKEAGKLTAQRYNGMIEDVPAAKQMLSDVQTLTTLGRQIGTGKEAQIKASLGPYAEALGVKIDKLGEIQAFEAIVNRMAPGLRVKGSGAQSDYELKNFLKSLPSLGTTPEGNEMASRVMQGLYENKLKAADIASAALNGEITRKEADQRIRDLPDPMKEYRDYVKNNPGASVRPNEEGGWTVIDGVKIREKK